MRNVEEKAWDKIFLSLFSYQELKNNKDISSKMVEIYICSMSDECEYFSPKNPTQADKLVLTNICHLGTV